MTTTSPRKYIPSQLIRRACWLMMFGERSNVVVPDAVRAAGPTIEEIVEAGNAALRRMLDKPGK